MNNRGQVAIFLVFIVALLLIIITLLSFFGFKGNFSGISSDYADLSSEINFAYLYVLKSAELIGKESIESCDTCSDEDLKKKFMQIAAKRDFRYFGAGNFFGEIRNGKFNFSRVNEMYVLNFENKLFVQSNVNGNEIERQFELEMEFNSEGKKVYK